MKTRFGLSLCFGGLWLAISLYFAFGWVQSISDIFPIGYTWWVIIGIALLPGFLMSAMFFSNLLHYKPKQHPNTREDTTIIMCAYNESQTIAQSIQAIIRQRYRGNIHLLVIDNASTDRTKQKIRKQQRFLVHNRSIQYVYCGQKGKAHALNAGLKLVRTPYFITVDADTVLEKHAVQKIMNHIVACKSACVAGNLFVRNPKDSWVAQMQNYDYLLSIAAIKRF